MDTIREWLSLPSVCQFAIKKAVQEGEEDFVTFGKCKGTLCGGRLVHHTVALIYRRSRETGANSDVKIILTWHDVLWGSYTFSVFSLSECGCSSGSVSCDGVDEAMWERFITGRPEKHREANVTQVCWSCLILPPAVFHLSSTAVAVLLRLYRRLICHRAVLTFTTAFTGQTKKASALTVQQQRTFGGVLAASARQDAVCCTQTHWWKMGRHVIVKKRSDDSTQRRLNADACRRRVGRRREQLSRTKQAFSPWRRQRTSRCLLLYTVTVVMGSQFFHMLLFVLPHWP